MYYTMDKCFITILIAAEILILLLFYLWLEIFKKKHPEIKTSKMDEKTMDFRRNYNNISHIAYANVFLFCLLTLILIRWDAHDMSKVWLPCLICVPPILLMLAQIKIKRN